MTYFAKIKKNIAPHPLTEEEVKHSLSWVIQDGIFAQLFESLIAGPVLIAVALLTGASNALIGYLVALPFLANIAQFPGAWLVDKYGTRKKITLFVSGTGRLCILGVAFLAFVPSVPAAAYLLAICYTLRYVGSCLAGSPWNSWMKDLIPSQILGKFFARRLVYIMSTALLTTLTVAFLLKIWPFAQSDFYGLVFIVAFLMGAYSIFVYYKIQEPPMEKLPSPESFIRRLFKVFKDYNFSRLILFLSSWNFAVNLAVPFFTVVLLKQNHLDISFILVLTTITQVVSVLVMKPWGKISDTYSNKSILLVASPLYVFCIFLFMFVKDPAQHPYAIPLLVCIYSIMGIAQAGVTLASNNIALKLAPKGNASIYLSANGMVNALTAGTAPLLGGIFADFFQDKSLSFLLRWETQDIMKDFFIIHLTHWDFFFALATIFGLLSLTFLRKVKEEGEVNEKVVISQFLSLFYQSLSNFTVAPQRLFVFLSRRRYQEQLEKQRHEQEDSS